MLTFLRQGGAFRHVRITGATRSLRHAVQALTHAVLTLERAPWDVDLHIDFVSMAEMREVSWQTRGVDSPTDVLTLADSTSRARDVVSALISGRLDGGAMCGLSPHVGIARTAGVSSGAVSAFSFDNPRALNRDATDVMHEATSPMAVGGACDARAERRRLAREMGTVYVCVEYMWRRCRTRPTRNLNFQDYLPAALVHAQLHALGYDHESPAALAQMIQREQYIGRQLAKWQQRYPDALPPLDGIDYLRQQCRMSS